MKRDEGRRLTDAELEALEKRIREMYGGAAKNLQQIIDEYFANFRLRDEEMQKLIGTVVNGREWTEEDYKQWRLAQMGRGERFEALRDKLAERLTNANEVAISYVNDATPGIYTLNRNYAAYEVSDAGGDFTLYDEQTVRRLIVEQPDLMPYYPKEKAIRRGIDLAFGKKQITNAVTSGILMGRSSRGIAADLRRRIIDMSVESAIRAARTAVTAAENGGRQATYEKAAEMGIEMQREWIATRIIAPENGTARQTVSVSALTRPLPSAARSLCSPVTDRTARPAGTSTTADVPLKRLSKTTGVSGKHTTSGSNALRKNKRKP